jgi:hypothetical protein
MKTTLIVGAVIAFGLEAIPAAHPADDILELSLARSAIFTPDDTRIAVRVAPAAKLAGPYGVKIIASAGQNVIHERTMALMKGDGASCLLPFPEVRTVTEVRCRAELFLGNEFIEACEKPIRLWPHCCPGPLPHDHAEVWAFDPSGVMPKLLSEFGVHAANATFQAVRDFGTPGVVFVGERLDPCQIETILERVRRMDRNTFVILLRQEQFRAELHVSTTANTDAGDSVVWERGSALLEGLAARDIMGLLNGTNAVHIPKQPGRSIISYVTGTTHTDDEVSSYLGLVQERNHAILFCQLPCTDRQNPRQIVLLQNFVQFACGRTYSATSPETTRTERAKP